MSDSHPKASVIRVLLVDDHAMLRQGLRSALLDYPNIEVVGEAGDGEAAIVCAAKLHPKSL
jgi:DNA-binding NarL/FixJ family response regulator